jgi:hypothetical protein
MLDHPRYTEASHTEVPVKNNWLLLALVLIGFYFALVNMAENYDELEGSPLSCRSASTSKPTATKNWLWRRRR